MLSRDMVALNTTAQRALRLCDLDRWGGHTKAPDTRPEWAEECDRIIDDTWIVVLWHHGIDWRTLEG